MMNLNTFGSPLLMPRSWPAALPAASQQPAACLRPGQVLGAVGVLLTLAVLAVLAMLWVFGATPVGSGAGARAGAGMGALALPRNMGLAAGVLMFSLAFVTSIKQTWAPWTAPVCALAGGVMAAGLSLALDQRYPGVVWQSALVTLAVMLVLAGLYASGLVQVTRRLRLVVYAATSAIALVYLLGLFLHLLGFDPVWASVPSGGIVLWLGFVAVTAAMNLVLDFERLAGLLRQPQPRYRLWFAAMGLIVSLVWLYVSVLRLLAQVRR